MRTSGRNNPSTASGHPVLEIIARLRATLPVLAPREAMETVIAACAFRKSGSLEPRSDHARIRLANLEALIELSAKYEDLCRTANTRLRFQV